MKQAILITAYKNLAMIENNIIRKLDSDFDFFIHIDKKCKESTTFLDKYSNVFYCSKYRVGWGGANHLWAILYLIKQAKEQGEYSYYHIITGGDVVIKSAEYFKQFFTPTNETCYLMYDNFPRPHWDKETAYKRLQYYWIGNNLWDVRGKGGYITYGLIKLQKLLGIRRSMNFGQKLYVGFAYMSLPQTAISHIYIYQTA